MVFDVITFGSAILDVFVNTDLNEKKGHIAYPVGSKILIKDLKFDVGGGGTNTAVAFSRLGLKTGCICNVGDDDNGKEILKLLKKEKVSFLGDIEKNEKSGYSIILDSKEKNRTILTHKGVNNQIELKNIKKFKTKYLYLTSLLGKSFQTQKKLAMKLKNKGVKIAFNPSDYLIKEKDLSSLLEITDILIMNKEEAKLLTKNKNLVLGLHELTKGIVVITDKNNPISCYDGKGLYHITPNAVMVVERTGAGDAFASGFVAGQIIGLSINKCLKLGLEESENVIKYFGAKNNLIKRKLK